MHCSMRLVHACMQWLSFACVQLPPHPIVPPCSTPLCAARRQRLARRVAEERARLGWVPPHQTDPEHPHHYHAVRGDGQDGASSSSAAYEVPGALGSSLDPSRVPEWAGGERNPFFKTRICLNYLRHNVSAVC